MSDELAKDVARVMAMQLEINTLMFDVLSRMSHGLNAPTEYVRGIAVEKLVLDSINAKPTGQTPTEIIYSIKAPPQSVYRACSTLFLKGVVRRDNGVYRPLSET